jgi:hypothetical protein
MQNMDMPVKAPACLNMAEAPIASADAALSTDSPLSVTCYDNKVPAFIEPVMHELYGSICSSLTYFRIYGGLENASTFLAKRNQDIAAVFFFRQEKKQIKVLNEGMAIDDETVVAFSNYVFDRYKDADFISFNAIEGDLNSPGFPFHQFYCAEDSVICLPGTTEAYLASLGKSTRKNIKQSLQRVQRDFPSFKYRIYSGREVDEKFVRGIIAFNRLRFASKNKVSAITQDEEERIMQMVRSCGLVGVCTIDGKLCAGSITYILGNHCHSRLRTHDAKYDDYRLSLVSGYLMISECIRRDGKFFHFMAGREQQKALLQGQLREQKHVTVYRSNVAAFRHAGIFFKYACQDMLLQTKLRLLAMEKEDGKIPRALRTTLGGFRRMKTFLSHRS